MRTERVRHVGIFTDKPERMMAFYEQALGFKKVWDEQENVKNITGMDINLRTIKMSSDNGSQIELLVQTEYKLGKRRQRYDSGGITHIALTVVDMIGIYGKCKEFGVEMLTGSIFTQDVGRKILFVKDPDGNVLELVEDP